MDGPLRAGHEQLPSALSLEHIVAFLHTEGACRCSPVTPDICPLAAAHRGLLRPQYRSAVRVSRSSASTVEAAGFYASEEALLREIEVRGPDRHSSPAPHGERAPSTVASSEDGDHSAHPAAARRPSQHKTGTARRRGPVGKGTAAADARSAIRLADPVRCSRALPRSCSRFDVPFMPAAEVGR